MTTRQGLGEPRKSLTAGQDATADANMFQPDP
jgi:hypothetical protein